MAAVAARKTSDSFPEFAANLVAEMDRRGIGPSELERLTAAAGCRVTNSAITRYRKGERRPQGQQLAAIAKALGVSVETLTFVTVPPQNIRLAGHLATRPEMPEDVRVALDTYPWPEGATTAEIAAISDALRAEWFAHRNSYIPPSHWTTRIGEELAARRGKRLVAPKPVVDLDEVSPEVRDHKAKRRKRS